MSQQTMSQQCHNNVTTMSQQCHNNVTTMSQQCYNKQCHNNQCYGNIETDIIKKSMSQQQV